MSVTDAGGAEADVLVWPLGDQADRTRRSFQPDNHF
jgi:hypothetical protein